ncbi:MAG: SPOR domain-containing protein [Prevotella sp.]|jgi:cell division protein FtsN|nr:SPOR domain-containing protein [Prevotella sp.]
MNKLLGFGLLLVLVAGFGSCKPKQSNYRAVYEAAKERELEENIPATTVSKPAYPVYTASSTDYDSEKVRQEKITPVDAADASGLRAYSVVIASLSVKPGAEVLKAKMEKDGYKVILAQNEQGFYRVIVASFDDKPSAVDAKNSIQAKYQAKGLEAVRKTYGVPFTDLWILQRQY